MLPDVGDEFLSLQVVLGDMRMHEEEVSDAGKPSENGEPVNPSVQETPEPTINQKYRELRSRLKYLIYVCTVGPVVAGWFILHWFILPVVFRSVVILSLS